MAGYLLGHWSKNSDLAYHPTIIKSYPGIVGGVAFRRIAAIKKYGHNRGQPDAAYALSLFL